MLSHARSVLVVLVWILRAPLAAGMGHSAVTPAIEETTCGAIKASYKVNGCCGNPSKLFPRMYAQSTRASLKSTETDDGDAGLCQGRGYLMGNCRMKRRPRTGSSNTIDPTTIPKYVTPLIIPPVFTNSGSPHAYDVALRQFNQQILPGGLWNHEMWNNYNKGKTYDFPSTPVWGYGPAADPKPDSSSTGGDVGVAPASNSLFNYPSATIENIKDVTTHVNWMNQLVKDPWQCDFEYPQGEACEFIPHILPVDQSLHWANPARLPCMNEEKHQDCKPKNSDELSKTYQGPVPMVPHVHGGHTGPESDGYPEAWWLPAASNIPFGYAKEGILTNKLGMVTNSKPGVANYHYDNDEPSTALWYHDHTLGMTRLNVYAGPAGFWVIREENGGDTGLLEGTMPYPAPAEGENLDMTNVLKRNEYREIPILIQDRTFNKDGSLFYPGDRAFFEGLPKDKLNIPFRGNPLSDSDVAPVWNPEVMFDVMVVNGVSWPEHEVEPDLYRFRILNACNSRALNLALHVIDSVGNKVEEIPFYVVASDQSLLPKVVEVRVGAKTVLQGNGDIPEPIIDGEEALLMGQGERADVIVDFSNLEEGTVVRMFNTAPDAPFGGFPVEEKADPETTGQIMQFVVIADTPLGEDATHPKDLVLTMPDNDENSVLLNTKDGVVRDMAVMEFESEKICVDTNTAENGDAENITWDAFSRPDPYNIMNCAQEENGEMVAHCVNTVTQTCATSMPFAPLMATLGYNGRCGGQMQKWSDPITAYPEEGATETWEFWDWTEDAHPLHIHLIKFRVIDMQKFDPENGDLVGEPVEPPPTMAGWKDTVLVYPGYVTRVKATFDQKGLYVIHCHTLEHEDNEMMVPYCVGNKFESPGCMWVP